MSRLFWLLVLAGLPAALFLPGLYSRAAHPSDTSPAAEAHLLEIGTSSAARKAVPPPADIKVVSYNIRWRGGDDLHRLIKLFREDAEIGGAAILGLQEVDRNKKRTGNQNTAAMMAHELGMYYAWAAPNSTEKEEQTGVSILSAYPLNDVRRLVLPHKGPGGRRRVALGATLQLGGGLQMRVYSIHSETRMKVSRKLEQMKAVIDDLESFGKEMPAIVLGDLNTWEPAAVDDTFKLFTKEGFQTPFSDESTFFQRVLLVPIKLKLDWIWLRNLKASGHGIDRTIKLSDHWPLWIVIGKPQRSDVRFGARRELKLRPAAVCYSEGRSHLLRF